MSDKPKRKNAEPTPRRYWWIFGTLAIVLLIGLPFPIRLTAPRIVNAAFFGLISLACLLALIQFVQSFQCKRAIVLMMLVCILMTGLYAFENFDYFLFHGYETCNTQYHGLFVSHNCLDKYGLITGFIGIRGIPFVFQTEQFLCCTLF